MKKCRLLKALLAMTAAAAILTAPVPVAAASQYVASDTKDTVSVPQNNSYQVKFTVYGTHAKPSLTVENGKAFRVERTTAVKDKKGNDVYYFLVTAIGAPGTSSWIDTKLPGLKAVRQCLVQSVKETQKTVPYRNLYAGFVLQNNKSLKIGMQELPSGDILLGTQAEWDAFRNKYLSDSIDMVYLAGQNINFKNDSILYHSQNSAKQDVFTDAAAIDKVVLENGKPVLYEKDFGNGFHVTTTNYTFAEHKYVILVLVKKSDLTQ